MLRIDSALTDAQEAIVRETIAGGIEVHRNLGPGYKEPIYGTAFTLELESRGMKFEREKAIDVRYKQWTIPGQRIDLIVEGLVIVELKAVSKLKEIHRRQILSYLKSTGLPIGLVMNFNTLLLKHGLMRVANQFTREPSRSSDLRGLNETS